MELLYAILILAVSFFLGYMTAIIMLAMKMKNITNRLAKQAGMTPQEYSQYLNDLTADLRPEISEILTLFTEKQDRTIFAYDFKTKNFICQGYSLEDLAKNCMSFKKITKAIVYHEGKIVYFIEGNIVTPENESKI